MGGVDVILPRAGLRTTIFGGCVLNGSDWIRNDKGPQRAKRCEESGGAQLMDAAGTDFDD
jgi:hypothetical protein